MKGRIRLVFLVISAIVLQVTFFPAHFAEAFKPNLLLTFVVYLGLRENMRWGGGFAFLLGLVQDSLSGIYFGLNGFAFLLIFVILKTLSHRLYTDSRALFVVGVFLASLFQAFLNLLLLGVFSIAEGMYSSVLSSILPHSLLNAVFGGVVFGIFPRGKKEEAV